MNFIIIRDKLFFYSLLIKDFLDLSFVLEFVKRFNFFPKFSIPRRKRCVCMSSKINVIVHEWGGYKPVRQKGSKRIKNFDCGLVFQLKRYLDYHGNFNINLFVSLSDAGIYPYLDWLNKKINNVLLVSNEGFDFSGYARFYDSIKNEENTYVILSNTSVNAIQVDFIDDYIEYMNDNLDVGLLGVSFCSRCYQSLIPYNFHPHLQSYFILTTKEVLDEIVNANGGVFPGDGITHKLLLIRQGEIKLSEIALRLGYSLAAVLEDGNIFKFKKENIFYNGYNEWRHLPKGDMRLFVANPNKINRIKRLNK